MKRFGILSSLFGALALAFAASLGAAQAQTITVGGKNFTEQQIMAEMTTQYLRDKGYDVNKRAGMGSTVLRKAQLNGQIDLYWEYTGTSLIVYNKIEDAASFPPEKAWKKVKEVDKEKGLVWLQPSGANNTYALAMQEEQAKKMGIDTIGDLVKALEKGKDLTLAVNAEFAARPDGLPGLQDHYGFTWPRDQLKRMDTGLTYQALKEGEVEVALVFATDGRIAAFNFEVMKDNKNFFPNYAMTPVVRKETLEAHPDLRKQMNALSSKLDDDTMRTLNKRVDVDKQTVENVANDFLSSHGLIGASG